MSPARGTGRAGDARRAASGPGSRRTGRGPDGGSGRGSVGDAVRERAARSGTDPATRGGSVTRGGTGTRGGGETDGAAAPTSDGTPNEPGGRGGDPGGTGPHQDGATRTRSRTGNPHDGDGTASTTGASGSGGREGSGEPDVHEGRDRTADRDRSGSSRSGDRDPGGRDGGDGDGGARDGGARDGGDRDGSGRGSGAVARTAADAARAERVAAAAAGRRRYRRRRLAAGLLLTAVLLAALAGGTWWALGRVGPGVQEIRVDGVRSIAANDVRTAAGVPDGTPLAAVDTAAVAARVAGIPGVADVDVSRGWPHTLDVAVVERMPVALVDAPDGPRLVDATGLAYRTVPAASCPPAPAACRPPGLPRLALPRVAPDDPATLAALAVVEALPDDVRSRVDAVELGSGGTTLELALTDGKRVLWGRWADSDGPTTARRAAILGPLLTREGSVYDVSSADLPTVRR